MPFDIGDSFVPDGVQDYDLHAYFEPLAGQSPGSSGAHESDQAARLADVC